ncbi:S41 family peptidase [Polaribacter dokdonensis]|uniref:Carboxyl-terminal processing protease n=1 Tax=Polaribacter dokdonensis DSW-5 TaxID=1300348 RepID=A0A0M9CFE9_9FLAO|nr:S41 family peptidase [Polaribacter dokdonensis]KOY51286.1 Peptidase family S41 [Polaribacter dokdonensis DSW-5]SEE14665.1 carboxyl-terminal processing protease [Polaribacter dokdonensis DSW-5]
MKNMIRKHKIALILLFSVLFLSFSVKSKFFEVAKQIEIYNSLFKELNMYYVDEINPADLTDKAIKNTLKDLDPYTNFYNEQDVEDAKIRREGEYAGIGVSVYYTDKGIQLKEIYKGFSADKSGLKAGDIIISVDGQSLKNMERDELSMFLKGTPNTRVNAKVLRQGLVIDKILVREKVEVNPVPYYKMIDDETGYITLTRFNNKASSEVKKAFVALKEKGMKKLVFDLRSNPGGSLLEAINISNFFIPKGKTIVTTKAKIKKWSNNYRGSNDALDLEIPIVVLVNGSSASASEIVSGSLQDYDRAVIMGQRSFGKGLVQRQKELTYGTQLKLTISKYYTPSGRCIQELDYTNRDSKTGIVPKFSARGINAFKTANGRTVYDGGGIMPDVEIKLSEKTEATKALISSKALFNFATDYYYQNENIADSESFNFTKTDFKNFAKYLEKDTTFLTPQEKLFEEAYKSSKKSLISKEYESLKNKLVAQKLSAIKKNEDILTSLLQEEILLKYYYKEGVYENQLKNDETISEALNLLKNQQKYNQILSGK